MNRPIDINLSGTTAVTCFIENDKIFTANTGDSRAILGYRGKKGDIKIKELSRDHKPGLINEAERIFENGGRVAPYYLDNGEPCGPDRVWLLNEEMPGLAMSRSIGDLVAASVGVTWEPGKLFKSPHYLLTLYLAQFKSTNLRNYDPKID